MKEPKNIEELFKESFNGFEVDPGNNAWSNIQSQINTPISSAASTSNTGVWAASGSKALTAIVAISIIGVSIAGYYYFDSRGSNQKQQRFLQEKTAQPSPEANPAEEEEAASIVIQESTELPSNALNEAKTESVANEKLVSDAVQEAKPSAQIEKNSKLKSPTKQKIAIIETHDSNSGTVESVDIEKSQNKEEFERMDSQSAADSENIQTTTENLEPVSTARNESPDKKSDLVEKSGSEEIIEPIFNIPNIFSPNGDNVNDIFEINIEGVDEIEVKIFNKSGKEVHNWSGEFGFWDGRNLDDSPAPADTYFYIIVAKKDGKQFPKKGVINLAR